MNKLQLGVFFGSRTCEHDVSIISAVQLMRAADREKYDVIPVYISKQGEWYTGDPLLEITTYTPFDPNKKGIVRVNPDLILGGLLISTLYKYGIFRNEIIAQNLISILAFCKETVGTDAGHKRAINNGIVTVRIAAGNDNIIIVDNTDCSIYNLSHLIDYALKQSD